jgi:8-oxo-dGTP diphosphatase
MPDSSSATLRYAAKALILERGRILCLEKRGDIGTYYVLPGGGQRPGELLTEALRRECREELGASVEVGRLRYVQEYIGDNHEFRGVHGGMHHVNVYFDCRLLEAPGGQPPVPDVGQVGLAWLDMAGLGEMPFYPKVMGRMLSGRDGECRYLGDSV